MTIVLLIIAIAGWVAAFACFIMLIMAALAMAAQEQKFAEEIETLKKPEERDILIWQKRNFKQK